MDATAHSSDSGYLKCCFHAHTREKNPYTPSELIAAAKALDYDVLAITEHDEVYFPDDMRREADRQGILLLPGIEASLEEKRAHVLFVNTPSFPSCRMDMRDLRAWWYGEADRERVLSVAPHPFYPGRQCLNGRLRPNIDMFDAVEFSYFNARLSDSFLSYPNRKAVHIAREHDKALVGTGDVHRLWHLGTTHSMVRSEREPDAIVGAIKESGFDDCRIEDSGVYHGGMPGSTIIVRTRRLGKIEAARVWGSALRDIAKII